MFLGLENEMVDYETDEMIMAWLMGRDEEMRW